MLRYASASLTPFRLAALLSTITAIGCATPNLPANVTVTPDPVDFGKVFVGDTGPKSATLKNASGSAISVDGSSLGAGTVFATGAKPPTTPAQVANNTTLAFPFTFTPTSPGSQKGTWNLTLDKKQYAVDLTGEGVGVLIVGDLGVIGKSGPSDATGLDFGNVVVNNTKSMDFTFYLASQTATYAFPAAPTVAPATPFSVTTPKGKTTLAQPPGSANVKITVVFAPTAVGKFTATLTWPDQGKTDRLKCYLQGNGTAN
ncbi:MAG TPA: choice-of-anchor D domain-containing protein [Planctomycetota bacterium]|nr:choice-of-anchor D domain-containing protein [Planctomycetota bacterium]